jgi:hypothetical protein
MDKMITWMAPEGNLNRKYLKACIQATLRFICTGITMAWTNDTESYKGYLKTLTGSIPLDFKSKHILLTF